MGKKEPEMLEWFYEVKLSNTSAPVLQVKTRPDVFFPTDTTLLIIEACRKVIKKPGKTLDLGCGCGVTGLALAELGLCSRPLYASDVSAAAVSLTLENADARGIECIAQTGSLFAPWCGETFDCIVDDVSGISEEIAKISPWFPNGVSCDAGKDGVRWIVSVLEQATGYLKTHGVLIFPVLSLSDETKIMKAAYANFPRVEMLVERQWVLPKSMGEKRELILKLAKEGVIDCVSKFGTYIWRTKVFAAWKEC